MITTTQRGVTLELFTKPTLFSPHGVDKGTQTMLDMVTFTPEDKVLDLGCGYGVVGLTAAAIIGGGKVWMVDIDPLAIQQAQQNAAHNGIKDISFTQSDGYRQLHESNFTCILSNPPYHVDFAVPKHFIEKGFNRLALGGHLYMVTRRLDWYKNKLTAIFGGVRVTYTNDYYVFDAQKRSTRYANKK